MSILVSTQVWRDAPYTGARLLVLLALADSASDEGYSWPKVATIAYKARINERNCQKHIAALIRDGWLARIPRFEGEDNSVQLSNMFRVMIPDLPLSLETPPPVAGDTPPLSLETPPPVAGDTPPVSLETPRTVIEPSMNRKGTVARARAASTPQQNVAMETPEMLDEGNTSLPPPPLSPDADEGDSDADVERELGMPRALLWSQTAMRLRQSDLSDAEWSNWIAPLRIGKAWWDDDHNLRVRVLAPGSYHAALIDQRFVYIISDAIAKVMKLRAAQVCLSVHTAQKVKEAV